MGVALTLMIVRLGVTNGDLVAENKWLLVGEVMATRRRDGIRTPMKPLVDVGVAMVWSLGRCCYDFGWREGEEGKEQEEGL